MYYQNNVMVLIMGLNPIRPFVFTSRKERDGGYFSKASFLNFSVDDSYIT